MHKFLNQKNVLGLSLETCCLHPKSGILRDGYCRYTPQDRGRHLVCARITKEFLAFSLKRGNDLITPNRDHAFPGLVPGNFWCLCIDRWYEAYESGIAPALKLQATHENTLQKIPLDILKKYAIDLQ